MWLVWNCKIIRKIKVYIVYFYFLYKINMWFLSLLWIKEKIWNDFKNNPEYCKRSVEKTKNFLDNYVKSLSNDIDKQYETIQKNDFSNLQKYLKESSFQKEDILKTNIITKFHKYTMDKQKYQYALMEEMLINKILSFFLSCEDDESLESLRFVKTKNNLWIKYFNDLYVDALYEGEKANKVQSIFDLTDIEFFYIVSKTLEFMIKENLLVEINIFSKQDFDLCVLSPYNEKKYIAYNNDLFLSIFSKYYCELFLKHILS